MMILDPDYQRPRPKAGAQVRNRPPELFAVNGHSMYGTEYSALGSIARVDRECFPPPIVQEEYDPGRMNRLPPPRTSNSVRVPEQEFCMDFSSPCATEGVTRVAPRGREPEYPVKFDPKVTLSGGPIHYSLQRSNCSTNLEPRGHYNTPNVVPRVDQAKVCEPVYMLKHNPPQCKSAAPFAYNPQVKEQNPDKIDMMRLNEPCGGVPVTKMAQCCAPRENCNHLAK